MALLDVALLDVVLPEVAPCVEADARDGEEVEDGTPAELEEDPGPGTVVVLTVTVAVEVLVATDVGPAAAGEPEPEPPPEAQAPSATPSDVASATKPAAWLESRRRICAPAFVSGGGHRSVEGVRGTARPLRLSMVRPAGGTRIRTTGRPETSPHPNKAFPHQSPAADKPGGTANRALPVWRMYSLRLSCCPSRVWIGTNCRRGSFW